MSVTETEAYDAVKEAIVGALGVDEDEVTPEATIFEDLGAESIDLLDVLFRIERSTSVKVQASDIGEHIQGGIPDDEFGNEEGIVSDKGLDQLKKVMPQIEPDSLRGSLRAEQVITLFTVKNLADLVASRAGGEAG
jgi:acyl carrier protein